MNSLLRFSLITLKGNAKVSSIAPSPVILVQKRQYSDEIDVTFASPNPLVSALKRGTGGRSSFNGNVVTIFGLSSPMGIVLLNNLARKGTQIIVPYRGEPSDMKELKTAGDLGQIMFVPYYLRNEESIYKAVKYSNVVVNCIGSFNPTGSFTLEETNVAGARSIAKMSRLAGVNKLIHISALNARPNPKPVTYKIGAEFFRTKYLGEQAVREEFPEATIIRPGWMFGIADRLFNYYAAGTRRAVGHNLPLWNMGRGIYKEPVYFIDVVKGIANAIFTDIGKGQTYEAVGPRRYELSELTRYINDWLRVGEADLRQTFDLRYSPLMQARITYLTLFKKNPSVSWGLIEWEHTTDKLTPGLPTLVDLGVELSTLESKAKFILYPNRRTAYKEEELDFFLEPLPARFQPTY